MSDQRDRLLKAWSEALSRTTPELDPGLRQRVLDAHARQPRASAFPPAYRWALAGFALAASLAVLLLVPKPVTSFQLAGRTGAVGVWLTAEPTRPLPLRFSDGTQVSLSQGSRARVTGVSSGGARVELGQGSVDAEVAHLPGASWSFGAGPFEVAVTGTRLGVSWAPDTGKFELSVTSGSVLVKGPFIQGLQAVQAGQLCRVDVARHLMELGQIGAGHAAPTASAPAITTAPAEAPPPEHAPASAVPASSSSPTAAPATSADSLLEAARVARLAGRPAEERAALLACRKRAPGQAAAAQAAYLLGRASGAAEAASWFETYLREQPQGLLAREAAGRLIESYRASGKTSAAQTAASRYLGRYPNGPHASLARQTLAARSGSQD